MKEAKLHKIYTHLTVLKLQKDSVPIHTCVLPNRRVYNEA